MKTEKEVEDMISRLEEKGEDYCPGMSYYEGVKYALEWVNGISEEDPAEE